MEDVDGVLLTALAQEEFWRFVELEEEESCEKYSKCHHANDNDFISPTHIARDRTAGLSVSDGMTGGKVDVASILSSCSVCDSGGDYHADGLPHAQKCYEVALALRQKFECNRGVNGNVASKSNACEEVNTDECAVIVLACGLCESVKFLS